MTDSFTLSLSVCLLFVMAACLWGLKWGTRKQERESFGRKSKLNFYWRV